jgi:hypothetical protein
MEASISSEILISTYLLDCSGKIFENINRPCQGQRNLTLDTEVQKYEYIQRVAFALNVGSNLDQDNDSPKFFRSLSQFFQVNTGVIKKVKLSLQQTVEAHRVVRR